MYEGVVKMLLGRDDFSPDIPDNGGDMLPWLATKHPLSGGGGVTTAPVVCR